LFFNCLRVDFKHQGLKPFSCLARDSCLVSPTRKTFETLRNFSELVAVLDETNSIAWTHVAFPNS